LDLFPTNNQYVQIIPPDLPEAFVGNTLAASNISAAVAIRDSTCKMSNCRDSLHNARLVPQEKNDCFDRNAMGEYNANRYLSSTVDDLYDGLLLRGDLHQTMDASATSFAFVSKHDEWVVHTMGGGGAQDLPRIYHNRQLRGDVCVRPEFMYARFALVIFSLLKVTFKTKKTKTKPVVMLTEVEEEGDEEDEDEPPKKRQRQATKPQAKATRRSTRNQPSTLRQSSNKHRSSGSVQRISSSPTPSPPDFKDVEAEAESLLETEHPSEIWQALYPPVGGAHTLRRSPMWSK
jgi:hypothetical protein